MEIKLRERKIAVLKDLKVPSTFKINGSSFVFMKIDVEGLTVFPKKSENSTKDPEPIKVQTPEGKTPALCLNTGKAQFLDLTEKVKVVELSCTEILE